MTAILVDPQPCIDVGRPVDLRPGRPWRLAEGRILVVTSGEVDLYGERPESTTTARHREFLLTAGAGMPLFADGTDEGLELWMAGRDGAAVADLGPGHIPDREALERWIAALAEAARRVGGPSRGGDQLLPEFGDVAVAAGARVEPGAPLSWLAIDAGQASLLGRQDLLLEAGQPPVPLPRGCWIVAETDMTARTLEQAALPGGDALLAATARCGALFMRAISQALAANLAAETRRFTARHGANASERAASLDGLASLVGQRPRRAWSARPGEHLLAALRIAGEALNTEIRPPRRWDDDDRLTMADRVDRIAQSSGLRSRQVALRHTWWLDDNGPLVGAWREDGGPVALLPVKGSYELHDPATGTVSRVTESVATSLSGLAFSFYRCLPDKPLGPLSIFRFTLEANKGDLLTLFLTGSVGGLVAMSLPMATAVVFDHIVPGHLRTQLFEVAAALVVAALVMLTFEYTQGIAMLRLEIRTTGTLQAAVLDRLLRLPSTFFRDYSAGDLGQRVTAIDTIGRIATGSVLDSFFGGIFSIYTIGLLFVYAPGAAAVALLMALILAGVTGYVGYRSIVAMIRQEAVVGRLSGLVFEIVNGMARLRLTAAEDRFFARWARHFAEMRRHSMRAQKVGVWFAAFNAGYRMLALAVVFLVIATTKDETMSTGAFLAFVAAFTGAFASLSQMAAATVTLFRVIPLYRRARPILESVPESTEAMADPGPLVGEVEVNNVTYRYADNMPTVLHGVSLKVRPGEYVALVGPSGCGKSTLLRLLLGFETPQAGGVYFDGKDLRGLDPQAVRRQLGTVLQQDSLTAGSIYENIRGATLATVDDAWDAARHADIAKDIADMPMGMHTMLADGAPTLSGGQVQRLLIARALAARPRILLFDEATSALDNRTQATVAASLANLPVTRIAIAHRLSTVVRADRIYVLKDGRIIEEGTYQSLMDRDGFFAELAKRQLT